VPFGLPGEQLLERVAGRARRLDGVEGAQQDDPHRAAVEALGVGAPGDVAGKVLAVVPLA
jgi:hypothetical protein